MAAAQDANQALANLKEYEAYYRKESEKVAKQYGMEALAGTHVTYPELAEILKQVNVVFKSVFGVGLRKNAAGQAFPEKRPWEIRG